jgi:serine/threonine protein kinase
VKRRQTCLMFRISLYTEVSSNTNRWAHTHTKHLRPPQGYMAPELLVGSSEDELYPHPQGEGEGAAAMADAASRAGWGPAPPSSPKGPPVHPACALDIWSLGVVTYRMLTGRKPFPEMLPGKSKMLCLAPVKEEGLSCGTQAKVGMLYQDVCLAQLHFTHVHGARNWLQLCHHLLRPGLSQHAGALRALPPDQLLALFRLRRCDHLSLTPLAWDFLSRCLDPDPAARPSAAALLGHPWLQPRQQELREAQR